jgi:hypothetical protein
VGLHSQKPEAKASEAGMATALSPKELFLIMGKFAEIALLVRSATIPLFPFECTWAKFCKFCKIGFTF